jgi:hypothetical protein
MTARSAASEAPWYLHPQVLELLAVMRGTELRTVWGRDSFGDEYHRFADPLVSSLEAWAAHLQLFSSVRARDVAAAVTGARLVGVHSLSDEAGLIALGDEIDGALRSDCGRMAA